MKISTDIKTYHILYKNQIEDFYTQGVNVKATNEYQAINEFNDNHPSKIFCAMYNNETMSIMNTSQSIKEVNQMY